MPGLAARTRIAVLLIAVASVGGLGTFIWIKSKQAAFQPEPSVFSHPSPTITPANETAAQSPGVLVPAPSTPAPTPPPSEPGLTDQPNRAINQALSTSFVGTLNLIIPVAGVRPDQVQDTFSQARSEGRSHDAIDIMAPAGAPVIAAADGEITKLFQSERGGTTIYQLSPDQKLIYYYAHLQRYADGLEAGRFVRQGEVIGFVGDTGNAGAGNYHLHFSIGVVTDPKRYWEGTNINPYPLLRK